MLPGNKNSLKTFTKPNSQINFDCHTALIIIQWGLLKLF